MKTRLTSAALGDLAAGWRFYERKSSGLGDYFVDSITADVERLKSFPGIHVRVGGYHRMLGKRFPFAIYYSVTDDAIVVVAILDCRRDPTWIEKRLAGE